MQFTVEITDPAKLAGITAACAAYNASLKPDVVHLTDAEYVQFVMDSAAQSYANQYKVVA